MAEINDIANQLTQLYAIQQNQKAVQDTNDTNVQMAREANATNALAVQNTNEANIQRDKYTADMNYNAIKYANDSNIAYQQDFNKQIFDREDTAYQRTVEDMQKAGLNPLAMNGTNGAGGTATAPQMQSTDVYKNTPLTPADKNVAAQIEKDNSYEMLLDSVNKHIDQNLQRESLALDNKYKEQSIAMRERELLETESYHTKSNDERNRHNLAMEQKWNRFADDLLKLVDRFGKPLSEKAKDEITNKLVEEVGKFAEPGTIENGVTNGVIATKNAVQNSAVKIANSIQKKANEEKSEVEKAIEKSAEERRNKANKNEKAKEKRRQAYKDGYSYDEIRIGDMINY